MKTIIAFLAGLETVPVIISLLFFIIFGFIFVNEEDRNAKILSVVIFLVVISLVWVVV